MNRTFRALAVGLLGVSAAALVACSSNSNPGNYGDACAVYAVGESCSNNLVCRCLYGVGNSPGCFCTQSCVTAANCRNKSDTCRLANDPTQPDVAPADYCFEFMPDAGLP
jgi:hypothetical protein